MFATLDWKTQELGGALGEFRRIQNEDSSSKNSSLVDFVIASDVLWADVFIDMFLGTVQKLLEELSGDATSSGSSSSTTITASSKVDENQEESERRNCREGENQNETITSPATAPRVLMSHKTRVKDVDTQFLGRLDKFKLRLKHRLTSAEASGDEKFADDRISVLELAGM